MRRPRPHQVTTGLRPSKNDLPELAKLAQFGAVMGLTDRQVRGLISKGRLEYVEIGRRLFVPKSAVDRFIANNTVQFMPRRNSGPRLRFLKKRQCFYICWTESGRSRERSTGTADREQAEVAFAEFLRVRTRSSGPRDPSEILVTDVLADYAKEHGPRTSAPWRIAYAVAGLADFGKVGLLSRLPGKRVAAMAASRGRSAGTVRCELGVLRAAINYAHNEGRLTRPVIVHLPAPPAPRERWLTRK